MATSASFAELLKNTFLNPDNNTRHQKEIEISEFIRSQPETYALLTADIIRSSQFDPKSRQFAITTFSQAFRIRKPDPPNPLWHSLSLEARVALKEAALALLVESEPTLSKQGANCTAQIFMLDLTSPRPEFRSILHSICSNLSSPSLEHAGIAVTALAAICDLMSPQRLALLTDEEKEFLLAGVCNSMKNKDQNAQTVLQMVSHAMPLMAPRFSNSDFLQYVLEHLLAFLDFGKDTGKAEVVQEAVNCLGQVVKYAYFNMGQFIEVVLRKVLEVEKIGSPAIRKSTCEFFIKCFKYERTKRTGFFDGHWQEMLQGALTGIGHSIQLEDESSEEVMDLLENYSRILNYLNLLYHQDTFPILGPMVSENLKAANEAQQVGAVMILESMVDVHPDAQAINSFRDVFSQTYELVDAARSKLLQIVALNCTERIISEFVALVFEKGNLSRVIEILLKVVRAKQDSPLAEQATLLALNALDQLAVKSKDQRQYIAGVQGHLNPIMETMFGVATQADNPTIIDAIFATMFSFIEHTMEVDHLNYYFPVLYTVLQQFWHTPANSNRQVYIDSTVISLNLILTRLLLMGVVPFQSAHDRENNLQEILRFVAAIYEENPQNSTECLTLMTTIIAGNRELFQPALGEFFERYLKPGLSNHGDLTQTQTAIMSFIGLIKVYPTELSRPAHDFLQYVFLMVQTDLPRELKLPIYFFLSDVMITTPAVTREFAEQIMAMNLQALQAVLHVRQTEQWDEEAVAFSTQLREAVIENLFCYIHGLFPINDTGIFRFFEDRFPSIQAILREMTLEQYQPTQDYYKGIVNLLADAMARLKNRNLVDAELIRLCYRMVDRGDPEYRDMTDRLLSLKLV